MPLTTRLCRVCLLPPGGAGELQWRTLQENSTWAGRCRGESRHRRDHCQQAARTNTTTDHEIHPGETTTQMSDISHTDMSDVIWFRVTFSYISLLANSSQVFCFSTSNSFIIVVIVFISIIHIHIFLYMYIYIYLKFFLQIAEWQSLTTEDAAGDSSIHPWHLIILCSSLCCEGILAWHLNLYPHTIVSVLRY